MAFVASDNLDSKRNKMKRLIILLICMFLIGCSSKYRTTLLDIESVSQINTPLNNTKILVDIHGNASTEKRQLCIEAEKAMRKKGFITANNPKEIDYILFCHAAENDSTTIAGKASAREYSVSMGEQPTGIDLVPFINKTQIKTWSFYLYGKEALSTPDKKPLWQANVSFEPAFSENSSDEIMDAVINFMGHKFKGEFEVKVLNTP